MSTEPRTPLHEMIRLRRTMTDLLHDGIVALGLADQGKPGHIPIDVSESAHEVVIRAALPGIRPDELELTIEGQTVRLRAERRAVEEQAIDRWHIRELRTGRAERTVSLPCPVDPEQARAELRDGVLTLTLSRIIPAPPKPIRVAGSAGSATDPIAVAPGATGPGAAQEVVNNVGQSGTEAGIDAPGAGTADAATG